MYDAYPLRIPHMSMPALEVLEIYKDLECSDSSFNIGPAERYVRRESAQKAIFNDTEGAENGSLRVVALMRDL
jgi:hypothetical protein